MIHESFIDFCINESVQAAKDLLIRYHAEKRKKLPRDISDEDKRKITNDPKFIKIRDFLVSKNSPGLAPAFTKFYVIENAPWEEIEHLYELYMKVKPNIADLRLKTPDAYTKIVPTKEDQRPAYEVFGDDLRTILSKKPLKRLYDEMQPKMKQQFTEISSSTEPKNIELLRRLKQIAMTLETLPDVKDKKSGETKSAWKEFQKGLGRYDNKEGYYPEYRDPKVAFIALVDDGELFVDNWGKEQDFKIEQIKKAGTMVGLMYAKNGYIVMSARTPEAQKIASGDTTFCINADSTFWSYSGGKIQINILDYNRSGTDTMRLLGMTADPKRKVTHAQNKNNQSVLKGGESVAQLLKRLKYPDDLIKTVDDKFDEEVDIKHSLDYFLNPTKSLTAENIVNQLISLNAKFLEGKLSPERWDDIAATVSKLLFIVRKDIKKQNFLDRFKQTGLCNETMCDMFDIVVGKDYTKSDIAEIKKKTVENFAFIEKVIDEKNANIKFDDDAHRKIHEKYLTRLKEIFNNKNKTISRLDRY